MTLNENKISFIVCVNDDLFFEECLRYLNCLKVPEGMEIEVIEVREAASMTSGYNEGMYSSDAKYKVYLHQDVFVINRHFIYDILEIFRSNNTIGMIGMIGSQKLPEHAVMWGGERVKWGKNGCSWKEYRYKLSDGYWDVECVDGLLIATQVDIPWRDDLFDGWDFYDVSQCYEMRKHGYRVVVPVQNHSWYIHDDKVVLSLSNYNKYRKIFCEKYINK